jgi:hypothetical protein
MFYAILLAFCCLGYEMPITSALHLSIGRNTFNYDEPKSDESADFKYLCSAEAKITRVGSTTGVFFVSHPFDEQAYIQCDEFGRAFIRRCLTGSRFSVTSQTCVDFKQKTEQQFQQQQVEQQQQMKDQHYQSVEQKQLQDQQIQQQQLQLIQHQQQELQHQQVGQQRILQQQQRQLISKLGTESREYPEIANPCTDYTKSRGQFFFPYPYDEKRYVQCDESNNFTVRRCREDMRFDVLQYSCV